MKQSAQVVYDALRAAGPDGMTSLDLWRAGCGSRAAARVADLRADGYAIRSELVQVETAQGLARVSRYFYGAAPVRAIDWPVGKPRTCPACREQHCVGTTCAVRDIQQGAGQSPRPGPLPSAAGNRS